MRFGMTSMSRGHPQSGMALIAVLWMVAALGIIVTGMVHAVRSEVRLVSGSRQMVVAGATGDAAIHLALQQMIASSDRSGRLMNVSVVYQNQPIEVQIVPLNGLIDINLASQPLLASLFSVGGKMSVDASIALAQSTIETRSRQGSNGRPEGFEANEDLLRVPGLSYTLYANIVDMITAAQPGSGRVNALAAPEAVLAVLAGGNIDRARNVANERDAGRAGVDTITSLNSEFLDGATSQRFRIQARVPLADGSAVLVSRSFDLSDDAKVGLPWRTFYTEQRLAPKLSPIN